MSPPSQATQLDILPPAMRVVFKPTSSRQRISTQLSSLSRLQLVNQSLPENLSHWAVLQASRIPSLVQSLLSPVVCLPTISLSQSKLTIVNRTRYPLLWRRLHNHRQPSPTKPPGSKQTLLPQRKKLHRLCRSRRWSRSEFAIHTHSYLQHHLELSPGSGFVCLDGEVRRYPHV